MCKNNVNLLELKLITLLTSNTNMLLCREYLSENIQKIMIIKSKFSGHCNYFQLPLQKNRYKESYVSKFIAEILQIRIGIHITKQAKTSTPVTN